MTAVALTVVMLGSASAAEARGSVSRLGVLSEDGAQAFDGPVVVRGRAWWLSARRSEAKGAAIYWRRISGGATHRIPVALPVPPPEALSPFERQLAVVQLRLSDGGTRAFVSVQWSAGVPGGPPGTGGWDAVASYALDDGRTVSAGPGVSRLYGGGVSPWYVDKTSATSDGRAPVVAERRGDTGYRVPGATGSVVTISRYAATTDTSSDASNRWTFTVWNRGSHHRRYTVRSATLARRAGVPASARITTRLLPDGSLSVAIERVDHGTGITPIVVDSRGRVRQVGRRIGRAYVAGALRSHGRAFVNVGGDDHAAKDGQCDATWITDLTGRKRGRRLPSSGSGAARDSVPVFWDGRTAIWTYDRTGHDARMLLDRHVNRLRLSSRALPEC